MTLFKLFWPGTKAKKIQAENNLPWISTRDIEYLTEHAFNHWPQSEDIKEGREEELCQEVWKMLRSEAKRLWDQANIKAQTIHTEGGDEKLRANLNRIGAMQLLLENHEIAKKWRSDITWAKKCRKALHMLERDLFDEESGHVIWAAGWYLGDEVMWEILESIAQTPVISGIENAALKGQVEEVLGVIREVEALKEKLASGVTKARVGILLNSPWQIARELGIGLSVRVPIKTASPW